MTQSKKQIKNIFGWLEEITVNKSPLDIISDESWDTWNSYMVHRYVSMNQDYIDIVNLVQKINPQNKKQIYSIYKEMIPKRKMWLKYIKNEAKKEQKELEEYIAKYFDCSLGEAEHYIDILRGSGVREILNEMGVESKESDKLIKKAKLSIK
jgi:hypothetical protein